MRFREENREEYIVRFSSVGSDIKFLPGQLLIDPKTIDGCFHTKLLKPYGPEEHNDLTIRFPTWNKIENDADESSINRKTSLNEFQKFTLLWMDQLSEIKCQTYNLSCYLAEEYKKLNSVGPAYPSPISIRSLKASVFNNVVLYIEAVANFLSAMAINIDNELAGSPLKKSSLRQDDLGKITETNGEHIRLEDKLVFSVQCISELTGIHLGVNKGDHNWETFKNFKSKRDSMTHIKIYDDHGQNILSLDHLLASTKITDGDIVRSVELLCWFNNLLSEVANVVGSNRFPGLQNYNDSTVGFLVDVASSIAGVQSRSIFRRYNIESIGSYFRQ